MQWDVLKFKINDNVYSYYIIAHRPAATISLKINRPSSIISHPSLNIFSHKQYENTTA